mmetsp:Transcript_19556/g.23968  ORF Transcript_19556/g.23968 Transcript_19556/m.23968 type:complete len:91 (+) Transcript_19556:575-847(+)
MTTGDEERQVWTHAILDVCNALTQKWHITTKASTPTETPTQHTLASSSSASAPTEQPLPSAASIAVLKKNKLYCSFGQEIAGALLHHRAQ